jgi:hypothetical protein
MAKAVYEMTQKQISFSSSLKHFHPTKGMRDWARFKGSEFP